MQFEVYAQPPDPDRVCWEFMWNERPGEQASEANANPSGESVVDENLMKVDENLMKFNLRHSLVC